MRLEVGQQPELSRSERRPAQGARAGCSMARCSANRRRSFDNAEVRAMAQDVIDLAHQVMSGCRVAHRPVELRRLQSEPHREVGQDERAGRTGSHGPSELAVGLVDVASVQRRTGPRRRTPAHRRRSRASGIRRWLRVTAGARPPRTRRRDPSPAWRELCLAQREIVVPSRGAERSMSRRTARRLGRGHRSADGLRRTCTTPCLARRSTPAPRPPRSSHQPTPGQARPGT